MTIPHLETLAVCKQVHALIFERETISKRP